MLNLVVYIVTTGLEGPEGSAAFLTYEVDRNNEAQTNKRADHDRKLECVCKKCGD